MRLSEYFRRIEGIGILATADASGQVNQAVYGRPHFLDDNDDETCSFIMGNRLSHDNLRHSPSASYLFIEHGVRYIGKRLSLSVIREEADSDKIKAIRHGNIFIAREEDGQYLVHFHIEGVRSLIGNEYPLLQISPLRVADTIGS